MKKERLVGLLDRIGDGDKAAHEELLVYIMRQSEGIQTLAFKALDDGGDETYEQLILTLADDPDLIQRYPTVRTALDGEMLDDLHIIAQMTEQEWFKMVGFEQKPPQELLDQLRHANRGLRIQAVRQLASYDDSTSINALIDVIRAGDRLVSATVIESLQEIGPVTIPALAEIMKDSNEQVRWHAAKALSAMANKDAVPALIPALQDKHYGVRWLAAEGLAHAGQAALVPLLRRLTQGEITSWMRQGAWHALNKLDIPDDKKRRRYKEFAHRLKHANAATIPTLARQELTRLGEDA